MNKKKNLKLKSEEKAAQEIIEVMEILRTEGKIPKCSTYHELKTSKLYFGDMWEGMKKSSVRINDRKFKKGDVVLFRERSYSNYTGKEILTIITHVLKSFTGIQKGYCVVSFTILDKIYNRNYRKLKPKKKKR